MKTVVIIWFAQGVSFGKSGTDSGTAEARLREADPKLVSQSTVIARNQKNALPSFRRLCPELLSRTFIVKTVVFIGCPGVPRIVRIDSVSVRARETHLPASRDRPVFGRESERRITDPRREENRPKSPRRASWRVRSGGSPTENEGTVRWRKNSGFSPDSGGFPRGFILKQE